MELQKFKERILLKSIPNPNNMDDFKWEMLKVYDDKSKLEIGQFNGNGKEYIPTSKDRLYFYPGCNVPRYKVRDWGKKNSINITVKEDLATAKFASEVSVRECINTYTRVTSVDKNVFIKWIKANYNLSDKNVNVLHNAVLNSPEEVVYLHTYRRDCEYDSSTILGSYSRSKENAKEAGFKKVLVDIDPDMSTYGYECTVIEGKWEALSSLLTDPDIYLQESIIGLINEDAAIIDQAMYNQLVNMFKSANAQDHIVAINVISNCNINPSLHHVLLLLQQFHQVIFYLKESKHVNFKSLLEYIDVDRRQMGGITEDKMVTCLMDNNVLTLDSVKELAEGVKGVWQEQYDSKHFKIKSITVSDEVKQYFMKKTQPVEPQLEIENND